MLRKILFFVFVIFHMNSHSQNIMNISYDPVYPSELDSVKVFVDLVFTSGTCDIISQNHSISNDSIRINLYHCPGALTVICNTTDSINLGQLSAGNYYTEIIVHTSSWSSPTPCTDENPTDSGTVQIIVLPATSIAQLQQNKSENSVKYNSANREFSLSQNSNLGTALFLYNAIGALVLQKNFDSSGKIQASELEDGVYFYNIIDGDQKMSSGRLTIF